MHIRDGEHGLPVTSWIPFLLNHKSLSCTYSTSVRSQSKAAVEDACNAIAWIHSSAGLASPSAHPFVKATQEGLQHSMAKPVVKKESITVEILDAIVQDVDGSGFLSNLRLATACLLGAAAFLWFNELIHLRSCNFTTTDEMKIKITRSKTDQSRQDEVWWPEPSHPLVQWL